MAVHLPPGRRGVRALTLLTMVVTGAAYAVAPLDASALAGTSGTVRAVLLVVCVGALVALVARLVRGAVTHGRSFAERLWVLLAVVWLVVVFFAAVAYVESAGFTGLRTKLDALYFSVTTLTTVGFGDITPVSQGARLLVVVQMLFDVVVVTTAVTLLASARSGDGDARAAGEEDIP
ncbi:potassium channel family protein [Cellulomonas sp. SLBN-39]|uniref:potassium channel family protein n=1 Tax=Cellulomonas sp. SLBN-39 TaxID=2768446 RepID=UPI001152561D|nr:potassium channel family protein [Cellulomonas sp. SLBN-39]TQL01825.1 ion channel [Cellulomonas sp. SLBN-39]